MSTDTACRMKHCKRCDDWLPVTEFYLRSQGRGMGRGSYCKDCMAAWKEREVKPEAKPDSPFANRLPDETPREYAEHAFRVRHSVALMKLATSHAKPEMRLEIKRELLAMLRAA